MKLGTATWGEGAFARRALVAQLPDDSGRVVDLNRIERMRLAKLGEGRPEALADALIPSSLRQLLESGPRAIQRATQTFAYARKWHEKSGLPEMLAPSLGSYRLLSCLPRPLAIRTSNGHFLDRLSLSGPGAIVPAISEPTIAVVGSTDKSYSGCCIAANSPTGPILGAWLYIGTVPEGGISITIGEQVYSMSTDAWTDLTLPRLRPAEILMLPPPVLRLPTNTSSKDKIVIESPIERLELNYEPEPVHPVIQ